MDGFTAQTRDIVVGGASTGGLEPLRTILADLPARFPASMFVVIHTSPDSPGTMPDLLGQAGRLPVVMPKEGTEARHYEDHIRRLSDYMASLRRILGAEEPGDKQKWIP